MEPVKQIEGRAIPFGRKNVDTDVIIPARWLKTITRQGLGRGAFEALRADPDNIFDSAEFAGSPILIAGDNFGCGSSREHAPWALHDYGIRALIAPSFADIFYGNCLKNGMLPIVLPEVEVQYLFEQVKSQPGYRLRINLERQSIEAPIGPALGFEFDPFRKRCLLNGIDDISLTLEHDAEIRRYEARRQLAEPWVFGGA